MLPSTFQALSTTNTSTKEGNVTHFIGGGINDKLCFNGGLCLHVRKNIFGIRLGVVQESGEHAGKLIVYNWEIQKDTLVEGVYHAYRQTWHILASHGHDLRTGETRSLFAAMQLMHRLNRAVASGDPHIKLATLQDKTETVIRKIAPLVERARGLTKQEARDRLDELSSGTDILGRINPSAFRASSVKIHTLLEQRLSEILRIDPHIIKRQQALITMIRLATMRLPATAQFVDALLAHDGLRPVFDTRRRTDIAMHLGYLARALASIDFRPYREMTQLTAADLQNVQHILNERQLCDRRVREIRSILSRCQAALAIKQAQLVIERMIFRVMRAQQRKNERFAFAAVEKEVDRVVTSLQNINESGLRKPVCADALKKLHMIQALFALRTQRPTSKDYLVADLHNLGVLLRGASLAL